MASCIQSRKAEEGMIFGRPQIMDLMRFVQDEEQMLYWTEVAERAGVGNQVRAKRGTKGSFVPFYGRRSALIKFSLEK